MSDQTLTYNPLPRSTYRALGDVANERRRQLEQYGDNSWNADGTGPDAEWLLPITDAPAEYIEVVLRGEYEATELEGEQPTWAQLVREEVAEAFAEDDPTRLRAELLQVAALCVSWVEQLDRRAAE